LRNFLTFVAVALVTALSVALIAPPFIDWSARREMVARALAQRIGAPVEIFGPVTLRALPTPYLEVAGVAIGPHGAPWLAGPGMRLEFNLASLFGEKIRLDDISLDRPKIRFGPHFTLPAGGRLEFDHIRATHAEIRVERAGAAPILLHDVNFDGSAVSASGPWRGEGDFALSEGRARYRFVSGDAEGGAPSLKAGIDAGPTHATFDGRLALAGERLEGAARLEGETPAPGGGVWPWRATGALTASGDDARLADAEVRLGDDIRALEAKGTLSFGFGDHPQFAADLKARTLNIDALLRRPKETFAPPGRAAQALAALATQALGGGEKFSLKLSGETAYLGARALAAPELALEGGAGPEIGVKLSSGLPGRGRLSFDGKLELQPAPFLHGRAEGAIGDFAALAAWIGEDQPALQQRLAALGAALPQGDISASGDLELSPQGYALRGLSLGVAGSRLDGGVVYQVPNSGRRGRLFLDLASDALDIEAAPNVEAGLAWLGDMDLDFRLKADAFRVERAGLASVHGGSLEMRATREGEKFALQKLSLANLDGASIEGQGEASPAGRWARVKLDAGHLSDFAALLARAAPGPLTSWLARRADDLGAAKATFEARRDGPPLDGPFPLDFLKADGTAAGARFALTLSRAPAPVDAIAAEATIDSADAGALLRKLGLNLAPGSAGHGALSVSGTGQWDRGFDAKARLALAGSDVSWSGAFRPQGEPWISGPLTLKATDVVPALAALGLARTGFSAPADLSADFEAGAEGAHARLNGSLSGSRASGSLGWDSAGKAITGALEFDRASLGALLSLVLGRSQTRFGPGLLSVPDADIALKIGALDLGAPGIGRAMAGRLRLGHDRLALDDVGLLIGGGEVKGRLALDRDKDQAAASGALDLKGVAFARSGVSGRLDGSLDFAGVGDSPAALIGGLSGTGKVKVGEAKIPRLDPQALALALARIEQAEGTPPEEKKLESLIGAELDKGALSLAGPEGALALTSGALRFGPLDAGGVRLSGALGLADLALSLDATVTSAKTGRFWSGPPPAVEISQTASGRKVDAAMLSAGLSAEAIARESDRIESFEADVRERAMFNRARKAWQFMDRRKAEIAEFLAEKERRRLTDYYRKAYEEWAAREPPLDDQPAQTDAPAR
jgi:hypothetical protein